MQAAEDEHGKRKLVSRYENHLVESGVVGGTTEIAFWWPGATPIGPTLNTPSVINNKLSYCNHCQLA